MRGFTTEMKNYVALNSMSPKNSVVLFGDGLDKEIPVYEIAGICNLNFKLLNRSFKKLSVTDAAECYEKCIAPLAPESLILHIGNNDEELFRTNSANFDRALLSLIEKIKLSNKKMRIAIVSLQNKAGSEIISEMNRHLKAIADSERCEFCDSDKAKVWNPEATRQLYSFLYNVGFVEPLKIKKPIRDIVELIYSYVNTNLSPLNDFATMSQVG